MNIDKFLESLLLSTQVEPPFANFWIRHCTTSYQRLPNRTYIELTSENVRFHAGRSESYVRAGAIGTAGMTMAVPAFARKKWRTTKTYV